MGDNGAWGHDMVEVTGQRESAIDALRRILSPDREIETHMAFVLLAGERAYKLRKSIRNWDVDYSDAEARRASCHAEVVLNREIAPDVYHGVSSLTRAAKGCLELGGAGREVDWVIVMRRLPDGRMLDRMLERGEAIPESALAALADRLAGFYRTHAMDPGERGLFFGRLKDTAQRNRESLARWEFLVELGALTLCDRTALIIDASRFEIERRIAKGQIVEGHGDLRPEHVCLEAPPVVFDRIEFSRALRLVDVYEEVGYLAMEAEMARNTAIGPTLLGHMKSAGFVQPGADLMAAYISDRCLTRARLCIDHLLESEVRNPRKWAPLSRRYIAQAKSRLADIE